MTPPHRSMLWQRRCQTIYPVVTIAAVLEASRDSAHWGRMKSRPLNNPQAKRTSPTFAEGDEELLERVSKLVPPSGYTRTTSSERRMSSIATRHSISIAGDLSKDAISQIKKLAWIHSNDPTSRLRLFVRKTAAALAEAGLPTIGDLRVVARNDGSFRSPRTVSEAREARPLADALFESEQSAQILGQSQLVRVARANARARNALDVLARLSDDPSFPLVEQLLAEVLSVWEDSLHLFFGEQIEPDYVRGTKSRKGTARGGRTRAEQQQSDKSDRRRRVTEEIRLLINKRSSRTLTDRSFARRVYNRLQAKTGGSPLAEETIYDFIRKSGIRHQAPN